MRVLLVDDDALIRDGLKMILDLEEDIEVVGTAANGQEAIVQCAKKLPEVVLMDIRMPIMDGVQATKLIKEQFQTIKVLFLTTFKDIEYIRSGVKYGAEGYVLKTSSSESIIDSVRMVYRGNVVYDKVIAAMLSDLVGINKHISPKEAGITPKEYEIMKCICDGLSNKEIADTLFMGEGTVRNYISNILEKL
ncbi:MAG: response regulator transcription factor, partial [Ruminiclostridium sp.]